MVEEKLMGLGRSIWTRISGLRVSVEMLGLPLLWAVLWLVAYVLFRHAGALQPAEGAFLIVAAAGLLRAGLHWLDWHRGLASDGTLMDGVQRILQGDRHPIALPEGLRERDAQVAAALNALIEDVRQERTGDRALRRAMAREWVELDALFEAIQRHRANEEEVRQEGSLRLERLGRDLKAAFEDTLKLDQIELNHRLRADQFRLQGQAFQSTLGRLRADLEQFENLLEELHDSFPRIRREEDALGRLADAGLRQGSRLSLTVKGLVAHTPRLMDETQSRMEQLGRFRQSADGVRDKTEALARRLEGFREEAQSRIRSFGGAQVHLKELDHVAQQTSLLAVNAAILAQQDGGSSGMATIGSRLRFLADQTAESTSGLERMLDVHQRGLERETSGLWDLQEVTQSLLADVHELLRTAGNLDHQGHGLERALETHLSLVDQVRQASERAELSLHEVRERAVALESAHVRQWGVEAKLAPERERMTREAARLLEVGAELARISQQNIDEIWDILSRHQEIRRTEAYRQVVSEGLPHLMDASMTAEATWNGVTWVRAQHRLRLVEADRGLLPPMGHRESNGGLRLLLIAEDALRRPEPSALESWSCDASGRFWELRLLASLKTESHRLALLALLRESALVASFQGVEIHIAPAGVHVRLPHPYPGFPSFLMGLRLELPVDPDLWDHPFREWDLPPLETQSLLWLGPGPGGGVQNPLMRLAHSWVRDTDHHEACLLWLPHEGHRPSCPWQGDEGFEESPVISIAIRCVGLGADPAPLRPMYDRLLQAGAQEGLGGAALCSVGIGHAHPEALLLRLFEPESDLAGAFHPDLVPFQARLRDEVLGGGTGDPYRAAWSILEDLQRAGWLMPLPSV
ncbi:methyl-accepting chemotaxis protein [Geothrix sp. PMB-07]|uniref:methyl-accepting chemotaxis protein n=1 Tax=Geothrix sp. PMB-07 TaxID=3068640 RepID=UPI00274107BC|nr:methyl-accepting chemotaxis protein [Geothrix sp. PMB-07]WLT32669.1 methyl-accepting chemotaxis protein [Geothrix sp. PMB-07]